MKKITVFTLTVAAAAFFAACGGTAENKPANAANANAAKPTAAAPTADALMALDKQANEAYFKGDSKFFEGFLSDKFVMYGGGHRIDKAESLKSIAGVKCDMKDWKLEDPQMSKIDADTYVFSYKGTFDGTCNDGPDGKSVKAPSPIRGATVFTRSGEKWVAAFHGETMIVDPKNPPPAAPKEAPKKEETKKEEPKKDEKAAANSNTAAAPAKPVADPNTDALVKIHTSGWEAWKAKDGKKLEEISSSNLTNVDPIGVWFGSKADTIKHWTEMKCEGVTSVKISDGFASALSPTVEMLTLKGRADGSCDGQKNGDIFQTAFYVKEGDAWKLAFMFESPGM